MIKSVIRSLAEFEAVLDLIRKCSSEHDDGPEDARLKMLIDAAEFWMFKRNADRQAESDTRRGPTREDELVALRLLHSIQADRGFSTVSVHHIDLPVELTSFNKMFAEMNDWLWEWRIPHRARVLPNSGRLRMSFTESRHARAFQLRFGGYVSRAVTDNNIRQ